MNSSLAASSWRSFTRSERNLFITGCCMLIGWIAAAAILWRGANPMWGDVLTIGFTELFLGRAAAIARATHIQMPPTAIVMFASYIDIMTVFLLFPLLTFSYRNVFNESFYQKHIKPVFTAASKSVDLFSEVKVAGVFLFVLFPFWGTGVVVGAILGYLLGLKTWANMLTVCLGTFTAVICWVLAYDRIYGALNRIGKGSALAFTCLVLVAILAWRLARGIRRSRTDRSGED